MSVAHSEHVTQPDPVEQVIVPRAPYPPSFVARFTAFIQRLPLPYGRTYLLLFTVQSLFTHALSWLDGWLPVYEFSPILLLFPFCRSGSSTGGCCPRSAGCWPWRTGWVLKLFHEWFPEQDVEYEARVARAVQATGLTVPDVGEIVRVAGRLGLEYCAWLPIVAAARLSEGIEELTPWLVRQAQAVKVNRPD